MIDSILHILDKIWDGIYAWLTDGKPIRKIRGLAGFFMMIAFWRYFYVSHKRAKLRTKEHEEKMIEDTYEKNEDGLYPWEVDTDISPKRISKDAEAFRDKENARPSRGRWKT
ncbi:hypothetical protein [Pseudolactococcus insecticola]|uniref:Uncharacterized protein n=1 Tax=Pseudolactococcus insecticola TaxID=2709158 RepID=A0A6A0B6G0_9LACT|nr:hypothetical protein [Lactococcus insecticola]GFH40950.1 hypothetical protein Hs20B_13480 [Lactococcus insecticola]